MTSFTRIARIGIAIAAVTTSIATTQNTASAYPFPIRPSSSVQSGGGK